jgi:hypothetical protein
MEPLGSMARVICSRKEILMGLGQILIVVSFVLLVLAALASWTWRPDWHHSTGSVLGWAGLACYVLAGLVG